MKKGLLFIATLFCFSGAFATKHIIVNLGQTFSPSDLTINLGDTVEWVLAAQHDVLEVSQATWFSNGNTALPGGFSCPFGGCQWVPTALGVYYYVCEPHASNGMKGKITVAQGVGIEEAGAVSFSFYPNPVTDVLNIGLQNGSTESISYSLYSLSGQKIKSAANVNLDNLQHYVSVTVSDLPRGVYMITVTAGTMQRTRKIVLQ